MVEFTTHSRDTAPEPAKHAFDLSEQKYGFTPNLIRVLAESPAAQQAYLTLSSLFQQTSLSPVEQQVVLLTVSFENACDYCMAAHTGGARMVNTPDLVVEALRSGNDLPDPMLNALSRFAGSVVRERGWISDDEVRRLLNAGYTRATVFDVLLGVALKTLSNYSNHIARTELDAAFQDFAWQRPSEPRAAEAIPARIAGEERVA